MDLLRSKLNTIEPTIKISNKLLYDLLAEFVNILRSYSSYGFNTQLGGLDNIFVPSAAIRFGKPKYIWLKEIIAISSLHNLPRGKLPKNLNMKKRNC